MLRNFLFLFCLDKRLSILIKSKICLGDVGVIKVVLIKINKLEPRFNNQLESAINSSRQPEIPQFSEDA